MLVKDELLFGQLRPYFEWIVHILLKAGDFHSKTNIYELQFSDMPHIVAFPRWPPLTLKVPHGSKIETCSDISENSVKLFVSS